MKTVKAAAVVLLLVLIPHQAPFAEPAESAAESPETVEGQPVETSSASRETRGAAAPAIPTSEGFVWSVPPARTSADGRARPARSHVETDGYSWSVRSQQ